MRKEVLIESICVQGDSVSGCRDYGDIRGGERGEKERKSRWTRRGFLLRGWRNLTIEERLVRRWFEESRGLVQEYI